MHVLVAGAGLAGLTAAGELARAGAEVTVVEARDRAGGRVWTVRGPGDGVLAGELGGEFVDAEHAEIRVLIARAGLELVRVLRHGFTVRVPSVHGGWWIGRTAPWAALKQSLDPLIARYQAAGGDPATTALREMTRLSVRQWLRQHGAGPDLHAAADALRGFFLADPDDLSVLPLVQQLAGSGAPTRVEMYRIAGGADRLVEAMLRPRPARLLLRHVLRGVICDDAAVRARLEDGMGRRQEIRADAMVVALPATTLRDIEIDPPLPAGQQRAIGMLRYGPATKALVWTDGDVFARRRARAFATDGPLGAYWSAAEEGAADQPSLVAFLGGGRASADLQAQAAEGGGQLLAGLCWLGASAGQATALRWAAWEHDPWARGGYAFVDPGFDPAWIGLLARRAGRIVFAGEHTSERWPGYMNGAVETGLRAARELLESR